MDGFLNKRAFTNEGVRAGVPYICDRDTAPTSACVGSYLHAS
jgi:hypothetical protein